MTKPEIIARAIQNIHPCDNQTCLNMNPICSQPIEFACLPLQMRQHVLKDSFNKDVVLKYVAQICRDPASAAMIFQVYLS